MSYIDISRKSLVSAYEATVCLTKYDCTLLLPFIENTYKSVSKKADKYEDIHNSGEATEKQEELRIKYSDQLASLESLLYNIHEILNRYK